MVTVVVVVGGMGPSELSLVGHIAEQSPRGRNIAIVADK